MLVKWPLEVAQTKRKAPAREPKPRSRPQKNPIVEPSIEVPDPEIAIEKEEVAMSIAETTSKIYEPRSY